VGQLPLAHELIGQAGILAIEADNDESANERLDRSAPAERPDDQANRQDQHRKHGHDHRRNDNKERRQQCESRAWSDVRLEWDDPDQEKHRGEHGGAANALG
jgi:hypothetical protein